MEFIESEARRLSDILTTDTHRNGLSLPELVEAAGYQHDGIVAPLNFMRAFWLGRTRGWLAMDGHTVLSGKLA